MISAMDMSLNQEAAPSSVPLSNATADTVMNGTGILSEGQKTLATKVAVTPELPMANSTTGCAPGSHAS